jgi:2-C-methyl-D-erythritol 2,4-cyclodiphosphate synthase
VYLRNSGKAFMPERAEGAQPVCVSVGALERAVAAAEGEYFLDDAYWKVMDILAQNGWRVENADMTILAQKPKLMPHIPQMRQNLSRVMGIPLTAISVKATTEEGMGLTGGGEAIAAHAVCLLTCEGK